MPRKSTTIPVILIAAAIAVAARAESGDPSPAGATFVETIDVRVINLEVVVTDRSGERVSGLRPEDFEVELDGDPIDIDYFTEIRQGRAVARSPGEGPRPAPLTRQGEPVPTRLLLFIDGSFGMPAAFAQFARTFSQQASVLDAGEQMAILFYDGRELRVLSDWTADAGELYRALSRLEAADFNGPQRLAEWRSYLASVRDESRYVAESAGRGDQVRPLADLPEFAVTKKRLERQVDRVARAVTAALYRYAESGGRQAALLWSGGWPWSSFEFLRPPWSRDLSSLSRTEQSLGGLVDAANQLGYTLYMADSAVDFYSARVERQHHETLDFLAAGTGGRAFKDVHALQALGLAREDTRTYYWLGLTVDGEGEGDRLRIEIETRERGLRVRAREHWRDLDDDELIDRKVEALAFFDASLSDPAGVAGEEKASLKLAFGEPSLSWRKAKVPLTVGIPLEAITMLPGKDGHAAKLQLRISVLDEDGGLSEIPSVPVEFTGAEPEEGDLYYYETQLEVRRKSHQVTVAVYDTLGGDLLSGRRQLDL